MKINVVPFRGRFFLLGCGLLIMTAGLIWRVVVLHIHEKSFLRSQGEARAVRVVTNSAYRGMILDRNHEPLAISTPVDSVWCNPKEIDLQDAKLASLAAALEISLEQLKHRLVNANGKEFIYLHRHANPSIAEKVKNLAISGVHLKAEYRRYYPAGEVTAHVIGFTNIDDHGQEGLELAYENALQGKPGKTRIIRDRLGRQVEYVEALKEMRPGKDIVLSLDQRLQYLAYRELKTAVEVNKALSGSAVVLDVQTGEILAMVNQPSFNPNHRIKTHTDGRYRNRAMVDRLEPGSVMKTFAVASALQHGQYRPTTLVDTSPGWMLVGRNIVREDKNKNYGLIDVATIMQKSSNVGVTKLVLSQAPEKLIETYRQVGFGTATGSGFPGESTGMLERPSKNSPFVLATMAFGYGLAVTPMQLAQAYAVLGASGVKNPISFLKTEQRVLGERVLDANISRQVVEMLQSVVEQGNKKGQVAGYRTAGKTGTVRKVGENGRYSEHGEHVSVFAGLAPADNPKFSIVILLDSPKGNSYYGGQIAAPVFSRIASGALRLFNIAPDPTLEMPHVYMAKTDIHANR